MNDKKTYTAEEMFAVRDGITYMSCPGGVPGEMRRDPIIVYAEHFVRKVIAAAIKQTEENRAETVNGRKRHREV